MVQVSLKYNTNIKYRISFQLGSNTKQTKKMEAKYRSFESISTLHVIMTALGTNIQT